MDRFQSSEEWISSTKREAYGAMEHELLKLLDTAPPAKAEVSEGASQRKLVNFSFGKKN